jgi:hypothetical protein
MLVTFSNYCNCIAAQSRCIILSYKSEDPDPLKKLRIRHASTQADEAVYYQAEDYLKVNM